MQVCAKMQLHFASVKDNQFSGPKKIREMKSLSFNKEDLNQDKATYESKVYFHNKITLDCSEVM